MALSFRHKGLEEISRTGKSKKVRPDQLKKTKRIIDAMKAANHVNDLNIPGFDLHKLQGVPTRFAVSVNGPWRITFGFSNGDFIDIDLVQYH